MDDAHGVGLAAGLVGVVCHQGEQAAQGSRGETSGQVCGKPTDKYAGNLQASLPETCKLKCRKSAMGTKDAPVLDSPTPATLPGQAWRQLHIVTLLRQFRDLPAFSLRPSPIRPCLSKIRQSPVKENRSSSPVKPLPAPLMGTRWSLGGWCLLRPALWLWHPRNLPVRLAVILPSGLVVILLFLSVFLACSGLLSGGHSWGVFADLGQTALA